jgi:glycosyltransferase involved in cell wall biosynthesis
MNNKPYVILTMIVKNESHIIHECMESAYKYIDAYCICDTGSTDNTKEIIKTFFDAKGIPGIIHDHEWKNFGHNRTLSFRAAEQVAVPDDRPAYSWVIDADDYLEGELILPQTGETDSYALRIKRGSFFWWRNQVFKLSCGWEYKGVLHEYAHCQKPNPRVIKLEGNYNIAARTVGGARNVGITPTEKYSRDAVVLEEAMKEDPTNTRHQFYLAQSYFDSQQWDASDAAYRKRVEMGGWEEEIFYSLYRIAMIAAITNKTFGEIKEKFLMSWNFRPIRAEPLYQIAKMYRMVNQPRLAYLHAVMAKSMPYPKFDILFIDEDVYTWQCDDEIASTAFYLHKYDEGIASCNMLLANPKYPDTERPRMESNLKLYAQKMHEAGGMVQAMRSMEQGESQQPQVPITVVPAVSTADDATKRKHLEQLLNRNKNKKKKTRR